MALEEMLVYGTEVDGTPTDEMGGDAVNCEVVDASCREREVKSVATTEIGNNLVENVPV